MRTRVTIERTLQRRVDLATIYSQVQELNRKALAGSRGRGWSGSISPLREPIANSSGSWVFRAEIVYATLQDRSSLDAKFVDIIDKLRESGSSASFQASPWLIVEPKELIHAREINVNPEIRTEENLVREPNVNIKTNGEFDNIFDRHAQIRLALDSLNLAVETNFQKRSHVLFHGPAGCGKTAIMEALQSLVGEENVEYYRFDAPSMTRAGALNLIMRAPIVCPIIFLEEVEKVGENELRWLLGIMDHRALAHRTNFRDGNEIREARLLVFATANNVDLLKSLMSGALFSRFSNRIYCPPPSREILAQILARELKEVPNGKTEYIEPALMFSYDECKITDPRLIINDCILGRERLLDETYQTDRRKTMEKKG